MSKSPPKARKPPSRAPGKQPPKTPKTRTLLLLSHICLFKSNLHFYYQCVFLC